MNWAPVAFIGRMSYSIYLYQQIAMDPARKLLAAYPVWTQFIAAVACVMVAACFSYYVIERPFLILKDRLGRRQSRTRPANLAATVTTVAGS
jgi:peptidoglycan/LPS O-acetylase OafA/YrhL